MKIQGSIAVISGGSTGIGAGIAHSLARRGAQTILLARNPEALQKTANDISNFGPKPAYFPVDVTNGPAIAEIAQHIRTDIGSPDILINSTGTGRWRNIFDSDPEEARYAMDTIYMGAFYLTKQFLPDMVACKHGHIVNITSVAAYFSWPGAIDYAASRWAMRGFTDALRQDVHGTGVGVTLYASSTVHTSYFEKNPGVTDKIFQGNKLIPILTPDQVGEAVTTAIEKNKKLVILPPVMRVFVALSGLFSGPMSTALRLGLKD